MHAPSSRDLPEQPPVDRATGPRRRWNRWKAIVPLAVVIGGGLAVASDGHAPAAATPAHHGHEGDDGHGGHDAGPDLQAQAMLATAAYQDVAVAEAHGYASSIDTLGCFQDPARGGMGVHYIDQAALDDQVDVAHPEALVYELDATGAVVGLVAHEYIVPVDAWTSEVPPRLFGMDFHRHPTLPLWVLHTWFWKTNPSGTYADWNPAVRLCPDGVPVFGRDLPKG